MKIDTTEKYLPLYEALASKVRLRILNILASKAKNIKDLATELNLSSAIITMHIKKLENAGLITSERVYKDGAVQKLCTLSMDSLEIDFPQKNLDIRSYHEFSLPV
jgi:predicted transcriptional regulator